VTIVGAHHTCYQVADLERSLAFYRDLLGFELVWERVNQETYVRTIVGQPNATLHQAMLRFPGSDHMLELIDYRGVDRTPVDTNPVNPGTAHICLLVSDFRAFYDTLVEAGVPSVSDGPVAVTSGPNEGRLAVYMIDPDGFRLELLEAI
jgi:catechol 2,3-dioxygenase-like lactoylglutathione lyase family enzyme